MEGVWYLVQNRLQNRPVLLRNPYINKGVYIGNLSCLYREIAPFKAVNGLNNTTISRGEIAPTLEHLQ